MTAGTAIVAAQESERPGRGGFGSLLHAEWTKFRTVRGWLIGLLVAVLVTAGLLLSGGDSCGGPGNSGCTLPLGPGGEAVNDSFYFVRQPLAGNGSITVQVTSLTGETPSGSVSGRVRARSGPGTGQSMRSGLEPWSKAGIIVAASTAPGAAYAAMMVTGTHGVRMQYDYTGDTAGLPGAVSALSPRWLRLTRSGDMITGYDSANGSVWVKVGTARLGGLPSTVQAGLFAASPAYSQVVSQSLGGSSATGGPTLATGTFDQVGLAGRWTGGRWTGADIGGPDAMYPQDPGTFRQAAGTVSVTGSGDIAPDVPGSGGGGGISISQGLVGTFVGLIALVVVASMYMTAEYRRGLIRVTLAARPRRGQALLAKAAVIAAAGFVTGLVAAPLSLAVGERSAHAGGAFIDPVAALTLARLVLGTAALFAAVAVFALGAGALMRRGAAAVTVTILLVMAPFIIGTVLSAGGTQWPLRVLPAAGFAVQGAYPRYPQVTASYSTVSGYYPLPPWAGFAVLCGWAAVVLGLATWVLRRRDA